MRGVSVPGEEGRQSRPEVAGGVGGVSGVGGSGFMLFIRGPPPGLRVADVGAEVARLVGLGAVELARVEDWVTLADPEGNEFDVIPVVDYA